MPDYSDHLDNKALLALVESSQAIISEPELAAVLQRVSDQAAEVLGAQGASVLLLDTVRNELEFAAANGPAGSDLIGERFNAQLGIAGQVIKTRRAARVDDVQQNSNFFKGVDAKTQMQTRSLLVAPLIHMDNVLGVVEVLNPIGRTRFNDRDKALLQVFANLAAAAVSSGKAYERVRKDNRGLRESIPLANIIGQSESIKRIYDLLRKAAPSTATVMITGETGTGKELAARAIHDLSPRRDKPFIAINCAALPETLLESELFGHEKGAFTGAVERKLGRFELADTGTLFLDEVGEMSRSIQVKLLRVLQEQEFVRVGGTQTVASDVRIVAATNRDLKQDMDQGDFREDLYYRLNVFPICLPSLRERMDDLPLLVQHFVDQVVPKLGIAPVTVSDEAMTAMMSYNWPGNVRELRNVVERAALLADGQVVNVGNLPREVTGMAAAAATGEATHDPGGSRLATQERAMVLKALTDSDWNQSAAARALGISRDNLRYRIKKYDLTRPA